MNIRQQVMEKLEEKNFNGADIHWFLSSFDIGIWIAEPYFPPMIFIDDDFDRKESIERHKRLQEAHYQRQLDIETAKWEKANTAIDYERHKKIY